eukprot:scaffold3215_cov90-Isochrysis_galbana.AAC.1
MAPQPHGRGWARSEPAAVPKAVDRKPEGRPLSARGRRPTLSSPAEGSLRCLRDVFRRSCSLRNRVLAGCCSSALRGGRNRVLAGRPPPPPQNIRQRDLPQDRWSGRGRRGPRTIPWRLLGLRGPLCLCGDGVGMPVRTASSAGVSGDGVSAVRILPRGLRALPLRPRAQRAVRPTRRAQPGCVVPLLAPPRLHRRLVRRLAPLPLRHLQLPLLPRREAVRRHHVPQRRQPLLPRPELVAAPARGRNQPARTPPRPLRLPVQAFGHDPPRLGQRVDSCGRAGAAAGVLSHQAHPRYRPLDQPLVDVGPARVGVRPPPAGILVVDVGSAQHAVRLIVRHPQERFL